MMDQKLKEALGEAFRAPAPERKAAFLKQHRRRELGRWDLAAVQAGYIRWWVWGLSLGVFGAILWAAARPHLSMGLSFAAALTPFLALLAVTENGRARFYQMEELELACRVPRASVLLARMAVPGLFHLALLGALTPALAVWGGLGTVRAAGAYLALLAGLTPPLAAWGGLAAARTGVYLLTPYLLTAALGMELTRRFRGREGLLACGGGAALVSAMGTMAAYQRPELYQPERLSLWGLVLAASAFAAGLEIMLSLKERELQWN